MKKNHKKILIQAVIVGVCTAVALLVSNYLF